MHHLICAKSHRHAQLIATPGPPDHKADVTDNEIGQHYLEIFLGKGHHTAVENGNGCQNNNGI
jgi:hypothetical protein